MHASSVPEAMPLALSTLAAPTASVLSNFQLRGWLPSLWLPVKAPVVERSKYKQHASYDHKASQYSAHWKAGRKQGSSSPALQYHVCMCSALAAQRAEGALAPRARWHRSDLELMQRSRARMRRHAGGTAGGSRCS